MTQSTDIIVPDNAISKYSAQDFLDVSKSGDYLPRLGVVGSNTELFKEGKIKEIGKMYLQWDKSRFQVLNERINVISYLWRPKALDMRNTPPLSYFDPKKDEFKVVQGLSNVPNSNCMFGPEFLVWVPEANQIAMLFCGSKSARRVSGNIFAAMLKGEGETAKQAPAAVTLKVTFAKQGKNSWHTFEVLPCNDPISVQPDPEELQEEINKFLNPPESQVQRVAPEPDGRER